MLRYAGTLLVALTMAAPLVAQTTATRAQEERRARLEAHKGDFDYLLGDWQFTATRREPTPADEQKFGGRWSAVRLATGGQILDEYRVVGDSGQTWWMSYTLRSYNAALDRWELVSTEGGNGLGDAGTGRKVGAEMHLEQKFGTAGDRPSLWRIRYFDIKPDRFSWTADRSIDGGKTWTKTYMRLEARRVGPPRDLPALTPDRLATRNE